VEHWQQHQPKSVITTYQSSYKARQRLRDRLTVAATGKKDVFWQTLLRVTESLQFHLRRAKQARKRTSEGE